MPTIEYKYNLEEMIKKKASLIKQKKELLAEIRELEKGYREALSKIERR